MQIRAFFFFINFLIFFINFFIKIRLKYPLTQDAKYVYLFNNQLVRIECENQHL